MVLFASYAAKDFVSCLSSLVVSLVSIASHGGPVADVRSLVQKEEARDRTTDRGICVD